MRRGILTCVSIGLSLFLAAPGEFPDWAKGRARILADPSQIDRTDLIHYRELTRDDFKGTDPPPEVRSLMDRLGAATCAYFKTNDDVQILAKPVVANGKIRFYEGNVVNLHFETVMNRSCSWWNVRQKSLPAPYVLQHEQIHFAIFEIAVRHMNERLPELAAAMRAEGSTARETVDAVLGRMKQQLALANQEVMAQSNQFDEDTSLGYRPERQGEWFRRIHAELHSTAPARSGSASTDSPAGVALGPGEGPSTRGLPSSLDPR